MSQEQRQLRSSSPEELSSPSYLYPLRQAPLGLRMAYLLSILLLHLIETLVPYPSNWLQPDHVKAFCLLSDSYSHMLNQNEWGDNLLEFLPVTTSWPLHGNVKVRASDPIKLYASSPNSIVLSASLKVKLEFEIHLVSWISLAVFRAVHVRSNLKSRQ